MRAQQFIRERRIDCWRKERGELVKEHLGRNQMSLIVGMFPFSVDSHAAQRKLHKKSFTGIVSNPNRLWWQKQLQISILESSQMRPSRIQISFKPRFTFPFALFSLSELLAERLSQQKTFSLKKTVEAEWKKIE